MNRVKASLPDGATFDFMVYSEGDAFISERIARRGSWEPFMTAIVLSLLRRGDACVDIGANIGWYTVVAALKVGEGGQVIAFEPEPANADMLECNVSLNLLQNVRVFRCALAEKIGTMELVKSATNMGDHRLHASTGKVGAVPISVETLDHLWECSGLNPAGVRVLKIDTQGAEVLVLRGARNFLAALSDRCAVFIEFSPNLLRKHDADGPESFIRIVAPLARDLFVINSRFRTIHRVGYDELRTYARSCLSAEEDAGLDLILAPHNDTMLARFRRLHAPFVKSRILTAK